MSIKPRLILIVMMLISAVFFFGLLYLEGAKPPSGRKYVASEYIPQAIKKCFQENNQSSCYEEAAKKFVRYFEIEDILKTIEAVEADREIFQTCHKTLHFVGREAYNKLNQDVSAALKVGNPVCFAGYYHGVLESHLIAKNLLGSDPQFSLLSQEVPKLCVKEIEGLRSKNYNECLHGLGHALMFPTDGYVIQSLRLCDNLADAADREWCYSGVFMENSTSSTNPDHESRYLREEDPLYPCNILEEKYLTMCYTLQSFYFAETSGYDWAKTASLCGQVPANFQEACFNALGQTMAGFTPDLETLNTGCNFIEVKNQRQSCIQGIVGALYQRYNDGVERMKSFCRLQDEEFISACYERMANYLKSSGVEQPQEICKSIQEQESQKKCLESVSR